MNCRPKSYSGLCESRRLFGRGTVLISLDTEQIWGYYDHLTERQFQKRYPDTLSAHERLLKSLCAAGVSATWLLVGGMALRESSGPQDDRMRELPTDWAARIPAGDEITNPLWYRRSFVDQLRNSQPIQEIGLHAGLTHFIWNDGRAARKMVRRELAEGIRALQQALVHPQSFSFGREQEAFHDLLGEYGIHAYRGRTPVLASQLGRTLPGVLLRAFNEVTGAIPPIVCPQETLPGLWNVPASLFLYPIGPSRTRFVELRTRVNRFSRGLEMAARYGGIFHFCLHPENLAESRYGFSLFEDLLDRLDRARVRGDVEVLTMFQVAQRMESNKCGASVPVAGFKS